MMVKYLPLMILSTSLFSQEYIGPIGDKWDKYSKVIIDKTTYLKQNTVIKVDKLILKAPLITNGHQLDIEAQEIEVSGEGKVQAFDSPAPEVQIPPAPTAMGAPGVGQGGHGGPGQKGVLGFTGNEGHQNPSPINIAALYIDGELLVNGDGQKGGQGGKGGPGSKGGNGVKGIGGYIDIDCKCKLVGGIPKRRGGDGGNGGAGGIGGIGGQGGTAGRNVGLNLLMPKDLFTYSSLLGIPGDPGKPGEHGPSGTPGEGGDGASDTAKCLLYQCSDSVSGGDKGKALKVNESIQAYQARFGAKGNSFSGEKAKTTSEDISYIQEQKVEVLKRAHKFHTVRLFQILIQDSIRVATNSQVTREQVELLSPTLFEILKESDKELIRDIRLKWEHFLTKDLTQEQESNIFVQKTKEVVDWLKLLEEEAPHFESIKTNLKSILEDNKILVTINLNKLVNFCSGYYSLLAESKTSQLFERLHVPLCQESSLKKLVQNPHMEIELSQSRGKHIYPEDALDDVEVQTTEIDVTREIAQSSEVIILNNRRYKKRDVVRPNPEKSEAPLKATLVSMQLPEANKVMAANLGVYLKILRLGAIE